MADLLFDRIGCNQKSKSVAYVHVAVQLNPKLTNWRSANSDTSPYEVSDYYRIPLTKSTLGFYSGNVFVTFN